MSTTNSYFQKLIPTPIGTLLARADEYRLHSLSFTNTQLLVDDRSNDVLDLLTQQLENYFSGTLQQFTVPLQLHGTPFQMRVWNTLLTLPYGQTTSYKGIACTLEMPSAYRAVGNAVGINPIALLVPCHRVLRTDGTTGGYRYGTDRKSYLLQQESKRRY